MICDAYPGKFISLAHINGLQEIVCSPGCQIPQMVLSKLNRGGSPMGASKTTFMFAEATPRTCFGSPSWSLSSPSVAMDIELTFWRRDLSFRSIGHLWCYYDNCFRGTTNCPYNMANLTDKCHMYSDYSTDQPFLYLSPSPLSSLFPETQKYWN